MNDHPVSFGIVFRKDFMGLVVMKIREVSREVRQLVCFESFCRIYKACHFVVFLKYHKTMAQ